MNKVVAIVGTHPMTREKAPFADPSVDIWIFNNQLLQGWVPRANVVFDIHPNEDIYRRSLEHAAFKQWLESDKGGLEFYTPFPLPEAPGNKVYPKDEIVRTLLPNFLRGDQIGEYFTSGPCYAIALAIYLGYTEIRMYGVEMESDSEYVYQRDGMGLWLGIAVGRGIKVVIPKESVMFYAPLYGYESDATKVDLEAFSVRAGELQEIVEKVKSDLEASKGRLDAINQRINQAKVEAWPEERMLNELAPEFTAATQAYEQAIGNLGFVSGQYMEARRWQTRVEKAMEYSGKAQEVLAHRGEKWNRFQDKIDLSGQFQTEAR